MTLRLFLGYFSTKCHVPAPKMTLEFFKTNSHVSRMEKRRLLTWGDITSTPSSLRWAAGLKNTSLTNTQRPRLTSSYRSMVKDIIM